MLVHLSIRDIVLIERLDLDLRDGLSVLTGETGAGKSILLDALSLALGGRGDGGLVAPRRQAGRDRRRVRPAGRPSRAPGARRERLRGRRRPDPAPHPDADGRSRVFINDRPSSVSLMREIGAALVEIHGQHDDRALVDAEAHRRLLDEYGGLRTEADAVAAAHAAWKRTEGELARHRAKVEAAAREADYLRAAVDELSELAPLAGEEDELAARRQVMMRSEKIAADVNDAHEELAGHASPIPALAGLLKRLDRRKGRAARPLDEAIERSTARSTPCPTRR